LIGLEPELPDVSALGRSIHARSGQRRLCRLRLLGKLLGERRDPGFDPLQSGRPRLFLALLSYPFDVLEQVAGGGALGVGTLARSIRAQRLDQRFLGVVSVLSHQAIPIS
jgi:hypothetical protein